MAACFYTILLSQAIVPEELMEMYLSMIDPLKSQSIDAELPFYCAFSFPAVLQTLGSDNWSLLKPTFEALACDMQVSTLGHYHSIPTVHV